MNEILNRLYLLNININRDILINIIIDTYNRINYIKKIIKIHNL